MVGRKECLLRVLEFFSSKAVVCGYTDKDECSWLGEYFVDFAEYNSLYACWGPRELLDHYNELPKTISLGELVKHAVSSGETETFILDISDTCTVLGYPVKALYNTLRKIAQDNKWLEIREEKKKRSTVYRVIVDSREEAVITVTRKKCRKCQVPPYTEYSEEKICETWEIEVV